MSAACVHCSGTGETMPGSGIYDCTAAGCNAAADRTALEESTEGLALLHPADALWIGYQAGKAAALEQAIAKLDSINDKAGDRAAYDGDEMTMYETEKMHAFAEAIEAIESLQP